MAVSTATARRPAAGAVASGHLNLDLALISLAQFVLVLDFSIVNVALPTIQAELHITAATLQWIVTGYALTFGSLLLTGGRLADLLGRRRLLITGLLLFGLSSLSAGLANSAIVLIGSRFVQGASAAMIAPAALATLTEIFAEGPARARALGIFQGSNAAGATAGVVLGGVLTQFFGWRAIFLVNPPIIAVLAFLVFRYLPAGNPGAVEGSRRIDLPGAGLVTASLALLIYGLSEGEQHGFAAPQPVATLVLAVLIGGLFVAYEKRARTPMVPFTLFADPARRTALMTMLMVGTVLAAYVYFISLYMQLVLRFTALETGLGLVPATATGLTTSVLLVRRIIPRLGVKRTLLLGLSSMALGQLWLTQISAGGSYAVHVLPGTMLTTFGIGTIGPTVSIAVTSGVQRDLQGIAGALIVTAQQIGAAVGLAVLATVAAFQTDMFNSSLVDGYRLSFEVAVGIILVTIGLVLIALRTYRSAR
jgi:EmrB/QacA subfamily drug resistance transporter